MIPEKLTIEGIYSYQERQTIDFTHLTSAGLFGIFGATGSGKSTILEAISFALYGKTERLNSGDNRNYNMLNLKSDRMYIEFDFYNHDNQHYRAVRELKRNSKQFEDVKIPSNHVIFYKIDNEVITPLENVDADQLIGMNYDNFKRTIIIPQGQFKEFLELKPTARTEMLKEIFGLQRFDLQDRVARLIAENKSKSDILDGQLIGQEEISEEKIEVTSAQLTDEKKIFDQLQITFQQIDEKYQRTKQLMSDLDAFDAKKKTFELLSKQQIEIQQLELKVTDFERIKNYFEGLFRELDKNTQELQLKTTEQEQLVVVEKQLVEKQHALEEQLKAVTAYHELMPQKRLAENDLELIAEICGLNGKVKTLIERKAKGQEKVDLVTAQAMKLTTDIKRFEDEITQLKSKTIAVESLMEIDAWFVESDNWSEAIKRQNEKINKIKEEIKVIVDKLTDEQKDIVKFNAVIKTEYDAIAVQKKELEKQKSGLEVHQKLTGYAHELHDGSACPLCGSLEHPHPIEQTDVTEDLKQVISALQALEVEIVNLQQQQVEVEKALDHKKLLENNCTEEQAQLALSNEKWKEHQAKFIWDSFDKNDKTAFQTTKNESFVLLKQIEAQEKAIAEARKALEEEQKNVIIYKELLDQIRSEENVHNTTIQSNKQKLKTLNWIDYEKLNKEEITEQQQVLKLKNDCVEKEFKDVNILYNELNLQLSAHKATLTESQKRILELTNEKTAVQQKIAENVVKAKIENSEVARHLLAQEIDIEKEKAKIQQFKIEFETLRNSIKESEEKLKGVSFDRNQFELEEEKWKQSKVVLTEKNNQVIRLQADLERLKTAFESKKALLKEKAQVEKRAENLKIMASLFYRAGFVQYASSVYLGQLCDIANVRFHRLTRNQLSLQMNANNEFEVIDYLNEGRTRSVKTLSGGQAFQVSLSLALALAESVQSNAKSDRNFFFIDEGFGTQDEASINIIFETLMHLNKEQKIVGIISHVEELKERIPASLVIEKDNELGSLIKINN